MMVTVIGRGHGGTRAISHTLSESGVFMGAPLNESGDLLPPGFAAAHLGGGPNARDTATDVVRRRAFEHAANLPVISTPVSPSQS